MQCDIFTTCLMRKRKYICRVTTGIIIIYLVFCFSSWDWWHLSALVPNTFETMISYQVSCSHIFICHFAESFKGLENLFSQTGFYCVCVCVCRSATWAQFTAKVTTDLVLTEKFLQFSFFLFGLNWVGLSWKMVMLHTSGHKLWFSIIWIKKMTVGGLIVSLLKSDQTAPTFLLKLFFFILGKKKKSQLLIDPNIKLTDEVV